MLTPLDIETTVFKRKMRGYDCIEVQQFVERVAVDYEKLYKENLDLKQQLSDTEERLNQYVHLEDSMRNALMLAQQAGEEVKASSQRQSELMIREAEGRVEQIRNRLRDEINAELRRLSDLRQRAEQARAELRAVLTCHLEMIDRQLQPASIDEAASAQSAATQDQNPDRDKLPGAITP